MGLSNILQGRFTARKSTPRKVKIPQSLQNCPDRQRELGLEIPDITVKLGALVCTFEDGDWTNDLSSGQKVAKEIVKLRLTNEKLEKEKNFFRVKSEILTDMTASNKIQIAQMEEELKQLRGILAKSPIRFTETQKRSSMKKN